MTVALQRQALRALGILAWRVSEGAKRAFVAANRAELGEFSCHPLGVGGEFRDVDLAPKLLDGSDGVELLADWSCDALLRFRGFAIGAPQDERRSAPHLFQVEKSCLSSCDLDICSIDRFISSFTSMRALLIFRSPRRAPLTIHSLDRQSTKPGN